jgi:hypothetical protein
MPFATISLMYEKDFDRNNNDASSSAVAAAATVVF